MPYPNRETSRDRRLSELAAIAQLYGALSGPQERVAAERQRAAMEMMGLMQQSRAEQARQAFQQQQLGAEQGRWQSEQGLQQQQLEQGRQQHEMEQALRQQQLEAEGKHWQAETDVAKQHWGEQQSWHQQELERQKAADVLRAQEVAEQNRIRGEDVAARKASTDFATQQRMDALELGGLEKISAMEQMGQDPSSVISYIGRQDPTFAKEQEAKHWTKLGEQYQQALPEFQSTLKQHPELAAGFAATHHVDPHVAEWLNSMLPPVIETLNPLHVKEGRWTGSYDQAAPKVAPLPVAPPAQTGITPPWSSSYSFSQSPLAKLLAHIAPQGF